MLYANGKPVGGGGAGGNANDMELTYAEYEALSDAEKMNGTTYYITDINGDGSQFQPVIYSTEEREIGVWTDGKPLYQKTKILTSNLSYNTTNTVSLGVSNADKFVSVTGFVSYGDDKNFIPLPYGERGNSNICITGINVDSGEANIWVGSDYQASNTVNLVVINVQYTKSTDTAGSGTWTPQGVPAHHYSTDEQIIGTWIDGSTLYQKTYVANSEISILTGNQGNDITSLIDNLSSMAQVVNCFATNEIANGFMSLVADNSNNHFVVYTFIGNSFKTLTVQYTKSA